MRDLEPEPLLFALAMTGLGILTLLYGDFAVIWQPVPKDLPWRQGLAYVSGTALLLCGIGLFFRRTAAPSALSLAIYLLIAWVLPQAIKVVPAGTDFAGRWLGFCETLAVLCAAWMLAYPLPRPGNSVSEGRNATRVARLLFGASCLMFGLSHFVYADFTAGMIPPWIPARLGLAYLTGAGHVAAGIAILFGLFPRLGATLEALMMSSFVLLVHVPALVSVPRPRGRRPAASSGRHCSGPRPWRLPRGSWRDRCATVRGAALRCGRVRRAPRTKNNSGPLPL